MGWLASLGLCIAGMLAIIVEFFVPAGGIIGILGFGSMVGGVVVAFIRFGTAVGTAFLVGVILVTPVIIVIYFKIFPKSFVGKWLILRGEQRKDEGFSSYTLAKYENLSGKSGTAVTSLRPSGMANIDGRKYSVVTGGEFIDRDKPVLVIKVEGSRIVVKQGA